MKPKTSLTQSRLTVPWALKADICSIVKGQTKLSQVTLYKFTCVPISTTRPAGMWK